MYEHVISISMRWTLWYTAAVADYKPKIVATQNKRPILLWLNSRRQKIF
jgi:hypothetical protein